MEDFEATVSRVLGLVDLAAGARPSSGPILCGDGHVRIRRILGELLRRVSIRGRFCSAVPVNFSCDSVVPAIDTGNRCSFPTPDAPDQHGLF